MIDEGAAYQGYMDEFRMRVDRDGLDAALASAVQTILLYRRCSSQGLTRQQDILVVDVRSVATGPAMPQEGEEN